MSDTNIDVLRQQVAELTFNGKPAQLSPVTDLSIATDILPVFHQATESENTGQIIRLLAALVGLSCKVKLKAKYNYDPLRYGGEVLNELIAKGVSVQELQQAGVLLVAILTAEFSSKMGVVKEANEKASFFDQSKEQ